MKVTLTQVIEEAIIQLRSEGVEYTPEDLAVYVRDMADNKHYKIIDAYYGYDDELGRDAHLIKCDAWFKEVQKHYEDRHKGLS
jgi:hypothetical protein